MKFFRCAIAGAIAVSAALAQNASAVPAIGGCRFEPDRMQFAGSPQQQATCLLRKVKPKGSGAIVQPVPPWLLQRIGNPVSFKAEQVRQFLDQHGIEGAELGGPLVLGDSSAVRYFVIHDTSSPELPNAPAFPAEIDLPGHSSNVLSGWKGVSKMVNLIISRDGRSRMLQDWAVSRPESATKVEVRFNAARKAFVHVENIQVRMKPPGSWAWRAPVPGFGMRQEERLALAYIVASLRAGRWLIPAYHYNIDQGIPGGHDDPQNADLSSWVAQIEVIDRQIQQPSAANADRPMRGSIATAETVGATAARAQSGATWPEWVDLSKWSDFAEDYRAQFDRCDASNRFRSIALPATVGRRTYYGCSSDRNRVTVLRRIDSTPELAGGAVAFASKLSVDLDGSWYACNTPGTDLCGTSLMLKSADGSAVPVSSDHVPYVVIPVAGPTSELAREFRNKTGLDQGDFGVVISAGDVIPVMVADGGPFPKLGEGSIALHRRLGRELCADKDDKGRCRTVVRRLTSHPGPLVTILFPGSRRKDVTADNVEAIVKEEGMRLWRLVGDQVAPGR